MKRILIDGAPEPRGHYSPAMEAAGLVFFSGMLPVEAKTGKAVDGSFEDQLRVLFDNLSAALASAGCERSDVVRINGYISSISLWDEFNSACKAYFEDHKPARTVIPIGGKLHHGLDVELDLVAERRK